MHQPTLSNVLIRLIDATEAMINRPSMPQRINTDVLVRLHEEVVEEVSRPREGEKLVGPHEILLADVLLKIVVERQCDDKRVSLWCQIAGVLLPVVREDAWRVMFADRNARASTSDQDYALGGGRR